MYKYLVVGFSFSLVAITGYALVNPGDPLSILMSTSVTTGVIRVIFACLLVAYSLFPLLRFDILRDLLLGTSLIGAGYLFAGLATDTYLFPAPFDFFFIVEGVIFGTIASLDFARPKAAQKFAPQITVFELLFAKVRKLQLPTPSSSQRKAA